MRPERTQVHLLALVLLAACGGQRPLATIEPVPGSRTREGGEIVPLDSAHSRDIRPLDVHGREIVPLDSAHRVRPVPNTPSSGREIRPLGTAPAPAHEIRPLGSAPAAGHEIRPLNAPAAPATPSDSTTREIRPLDSEVVPVDGTSWQGSYAEGEITLEFLVGGILRYTTSSGTWSNGTWHQESNVITFEMNSHYAEYTGHIRGSQMSGTGHNTTGRSWEWSATRQ